MRAVAFRVLILVGVSAALGGATAGCGPKYPACNNDEDCNKEKDRHEFCVNQLCQQCRDARDCGPGRQCNKGLCEAIVGYCEDDRACPETQACVEHRCQPCSSDAQCGDGGRCSGGQCQRAKVCKTDDDCPQSADCKAGRCVPAAPRTASQEAPCRLQSVYFDFNESALSTDAVAAIDAAAECLRRVGRGAEVVGRSDPRGTEEYNLALSERRAIAVKERLVRLGIEGGKLRTLPKGELEATGRDEAGWAQDRRVDFQWR